jgi:PAS domain S-box-containing protein
MFISQNVGKNTVVIEDDLIVVTSHDSQTDIVTAALRLSIESAVAEIQSRGKPVLVLIDVRDLKLRENRISGRLESRKILELPVDNWAIVGPGRTLTMAKYLGRLAHASDKMRYFRTPSQARAWLKTSRQETTVRKQPPYFIAIGLTIIFIGARSLTGWITGNLRVFHWLPNLHPINPILAINIIVLGILLILNQRKLHIRLCKFVGGLFALTGLVALYNPFSYLLFSEKVHHLGVTATISYSACICLVATGVCIALIGHRSKAIRTLQLSMIVLTFIVSLANIMIALYGHDYFYGLHRQVIMTGNLAFAYILVSTGLLLAISKRYWPNLLTNVSRLSWFILLLFFALQVATYANWSQSVQYNRKQSSQLFATRTHEIRDTVNENLGGYVKLLHGFQGLFSASDAVSEGEFNIYNQLIESSTAYPGLRSTGFISAVATKDIPAFEQSRAADTSLLPYGRPGYKVKSLSTEPVHYIGTYSSNTGGILDLDLTSLPKRTAIYGGAIAENRLKASGTLTFIASKISPEQQGFLFTVPVHTKTDQKSIGLVNVTFSYKNFFPSLFGQHDFTKDITLQLKDSSGKQIYAFDNLHGSTSQIQSFPVTIADQTWLATVMSNDSFGITLAQQKLPIILVFSGQLLSLLLLVLFVFQTRSQREALSLADSITADLQTERNNMVAITERDEAILNGIGDGLIVFDSEGRVERVNAAAERMLGIQEGNLLQQTYAEALKATDKNGRAIPVSQRPITRALESGKIITTDNLYYSNRDGKRFPIQLNVAPIRLGNKTLGAIQIFRDITHERELDKAKDEFVSLASHQLRTPLSTINWYLEMVLNGDAGKVTAKQRKYLTDVAGANQRMVALVNALLNTSRVDLGTLSITPTPVDLRIIIGNVLTELEGMVAQKSLHIEQHVDTSLGLYNTDQRLMHVIFQNLLSNAVKYTPESGTVSVSVSQQLKHLVIIVSDTGYGIPKHQHGKIFSKLFRADNVQKLDTDGTGLGLYIVKAIVQESGGNIQFTSEEGVGTTFTIELPASGMRKRRGTSAMGQS